MTKIEIVTDFVTQNRRVPTQEEFFELLGEQSESTRTKYRISAEATLAQLPSETLQAPPYPDSVGPPPPVPPPVPPPTSPPTSPPAPPPAPPMEDQDDSVEIEGFTSRPPGKTPVLLENGIEVSITLLKETSNFLIYARTPNI